MLCTHKTTILCQFGLFCHQLTTISPSILIHFLWELYHSWLSFGYQTGMQVLYITPALNFWLIVVSSVFQLFSSLERFSLIPQCPPSFINSHSMHHSIPVTPCSRPLPLCFGDHMHHGFHPKYPLKFHQDDHWMTCHPPQLPQPPTSFFMLLLMAWTCWMNTLHSWFTWLLFQEGENRRPFQPNFETHHPLSLCHPFKARDPL